MCHGKQCRQQCAWLIIENGCCQDQEAVPVGWIVGGAGGGLTLGERAADNSDQWPWK
jgi:hypothetical protein